MVRYTMWVCDIIKIDNRLVTTADIMDGVKCMNAQIKYWWTKIEIKKPADLCFLIIIHKGSPMWHIIFFNSQQISKILMGLFQSLLGSYKLDSKISIKH